MYLHDIGNFCKVLSCELVSGDFHAEFYIAEINAAQNIREKTS
jgi:hypothetical protein